MNQSFALGSSRAPQPGPFELRFAMVRVRSIMGYGFVGVALGVLGGACGTVLGVDGEPSGDDAGPPIVTSDAHDARGPSDGGDADAGPAKKRIVLSVSLFTGDLIGQARTLQVIDADAGPDAGAQAADALCAREAMLEQLGGKRWVAWVSANNLSPLARITDLGPRYSVAGTRVLKGLGALPDVPIPLPDGGSPEGGVVWTGTGNSGIPANQTCNSWLGTGGSGEIGSPELPGAWSSASMQQQCSNSAHLYCIED